MAATTPVQMIDDDVPVPPTEDELPYDDGEPMESPRHRSQMNLLIETLQVYWSDHIIAGFVGGNMFVHFNLDWALNKDFRGPDFFAVLDVPSRERKSWVVWAEGKGPDVIIELLSDSTAALDRGEKKFVYQDKLRVPEYFWYHPFTGEWAGFALQKNVYVPLERDEQDRFISETLGLALVRWTGRYQGIEAEWLRWATLEGDLLPTEGEKGRQQAEAAQQRAAELERRLAQYRERYGDEV
ncbi:MAG: Uma2 family endonuclease [Chloroflexaceae bacterium]